MAKKNLEQSQLLNAISFFEEIKRQAPEGNPKIFEYLDQAEGELTKKLIKFLQDKEEKIT